MVQPILSRNAAKAQSGFIKGRYFTNNVAHVDTICRQFSNLYHIYGNAIAVFFDFCNAFPSIALQCIPLVLQQLGAPLGFVSFVHFLYHDVHCFLKHCGLMVFMCMIAV